MEVTYGPKCDLTNPDQVPDHDSDLCGELAEGWKTIRALSVQLQFKIWEFVLQQSETAGRIIGGEAGLCHRGKIR